MRFVYGILCSIVAAVSFSSSAAWAQAATCEPDKVATKYPTLTGKTLIIGQDGESPPFSQRDPKDFNKIIGLDADTARAVFACAGVPIEFKIGSWSGLIPATMAGQIDVMWDTLLYTPERAKSLDFVAYMNAATGVLVAKGNPHGIKSIEDLCGRQATAGLGTTQERMLREGSEKCTAGGKKPIEIITTPDIPSGLRLVQNGRADAIATNKFLGDTISADPDSKLGTGFSVVTGARIAAGTAKGRADVVKAIEDGLNVLQSNGQLKEIFDRYKVDYAVVTKPEVLRQ